MVFGSYSLTLTFMLLSTHLAKGIIGLAAAASVAAGPMVIAQGNDYKDDGKHSKVSSSVSANINPSGHVLVRGATVTGVSGNTVTATTLWNSTTLTWTVLTASSTEVLGKNGDDKRNALTLADIKVGDTVNFQGTLSAGTGLTVTARVLRDLSVVKPVKPVLQKDIFQGKLESVASTTLPTTLGLKVGSTLYTVAVPLGPPILKSNFPAPTLATLQVGDIVRVYGSVSASNNTTIDALIVRDASR